MIIFAASNFVIMELLKNYKKNGWSFDILQEGLDQEKKAYYFNLRITNNTNKKQKIKIDAKYLSVSTGMHLLEKLLPNIGITNGDCFLPANFFVDQKMYFSELNEITDGDRIEFEVFNVVSLLLMRNQGLWYVADKNERSTDEELKKRVEHFEAIEEKFGISLQNFSVHVLNTYTISLCCEVLGTNMKLAKEAFSVEVAVYDTENNILGFNSVHKYEGDFEGFEVFVFYSMSLRIPVEDIGKIRFYPTR